MVFLLGEGGIRIERCTRGRSIRIMSMDMDIWVTHAESRQRPISPIIQRNCGGNSGGSAGASISPFVSLHAHFYTAMERALDAACVCTSHIPNADACTVSRMKYIHAKIASVYVPVKLLSDSAFRQHGV